MIVVDNEFESLIPPLADDEYELLEESILADGFHAHEPIITWNGIIVDGHNRYRICQEHGIKFITNDVQFDSRDAAKIWILKHQLGRRNLNKAQRMEAVRKLESSIAAEMKRKHDANGGDKKSDEYQKSARPKSDAPISKERTDVIMARMANVGKNQMREYKEIAEKADEGDPVAIQEKEALLSGEKKSVHGAHVKVFGKKPCKSNDATNNGEQKVCSMCGEPIKDGDEASYWKGAHIECVKEYKRDKDRELRQKKDATKKARYTEDGRRICLLCGEPIENGEHFQDKLNWCKSCGRKHETEMQIKYRERKRLENNITIGDVNEVIEHDTAELKRQLLLDARGAWGNIQATISRYESMGVIIPDAEADGIGDAMELLIKAIQEIKESQ